MRHFTTLLFCVFHFVAFAQLKEYDHYREITVNSSFVYGSENLTSFNAYFSFTDNSLRTTSNGGKVENSNGYDIVFSTDFCSILEHEIDEYDPSTGLIKGWVKIPVAKFDQDTSIYILYGNNTISSSQESAAIWGSEYASVWHMNDNLDATSNNHDFNQTNGNPTTVTGKLGNAKSFDGNDDYYIDDDGENYINGLTEFTTSVWVKANSTGGDNGIFYGKNRNNGSDDVFGLRYDASGFNCSGSNKIKTGITSSGEYTGETSSNSQTTNWQHLTITWKTNEQLLVYIDGIQTSITSSCYQGSTSPSSISGASRLLVGAGAKSEDWDGIIDELHFLNVKKSDGWIKTVYENQNNPSNLLSLGSEFAVSDFASTGNGNWNSSSTWAGGVVPDKKTPLVTVNHNIDIDNNSFASNINVNPGNTLTINTGKNLTVTCAIENNGSVEINENANLIQTASSDLNTGGNDYTYKRTGNANNAYFNIWSSPVANQPIHDNGGVFSNTNPCDIFYFDANAQNWSHDFSPGYSTTCNGNAVTFTSSFVISGGDNLMNSGEGYFVPGNSTSQRVFNGRVHNANISVPVVSPNISNNNWSGTNWNLLGNPYPSAISIQAFRDANSSLIANNSAMYFWDNQSSPNYNEADYVTVNSAGFVNSNRATYGTAPASIPAGQGFMIEASQNGNITFQNDFRTTVGNNRFYKNSSHNKSGSKVWVRATHPSGAKSDILVAFLDQATNGRDRDYDAVKNEGNSYLSFSTLIENDTNRGYVIQGLPKASLQETTSIQLKLNCDSAANYKFEKIHSLDFDNEIYLVDLKNDNSYSLSKEVSIFVNPDRDKYRFKLKIIGEKPTGLNRSQNKKSNIRVSQSEAFIKLQNLENRPPEEILIYDATGRLFNQNQNKAMIEKPQVPGVYIIKSSGKEFNITKKLLIP
jgi:hypothetical protein